MGYDRGDSFPFDFEPNGIQFGSENRKEKNMLRGVSLSDSRGRVHRVNIYGIYNIIYIYILLYICI